MFLGWNRAKGAPAPSYTITLPADAASKWQLGAGSTVELSIAALDEDAPLPGKKKEEKEKERDESKKKDRESPDFTIELVTSDGVVATARGEPLRGSPAAAQGDVHETQSAGEPGVREGLGAGVPDRALATRVISERTVPSHSTRGD